MRKTTFRILAVATLAVALNLGLVLPAAAQSSLDVGMVPMGPNLVPNLTLSGPPGGYDIQYALDIGGAQISWTTNLTRLNLMAGTTNYLDYSATNRIRRCYRAVAVTPDPSLFVWIPPGTFVMGSPSAEAERTAATETQHTVRLTKGFYMSRYLVTQGDYVALLGYDPSYYSTIGDTNFPVETVSWNDATNYCGLLTAQERLAGRLPAGWAYKLPTEAQWEYACRAGTTTALNFGSAIYGGMANFNSSYEYDSTLGWIYPVVPVGNMGMPTPVGSYPPNGFGLYDMHGNVAEWCQDWYNVYPTGSVDDPTGPATAPFSKPQDNMRVARGGNWDAPGANCRSACRDGSQQPAHEDSNYGFRVVIIPSQP